MRLFLRFWNAQSGMPQPSLNTSAFTALETVIRLKESPTDDLMPPSPTSVKAFLSSPSGMRDGDGGPDKNGVRYKAWESASQGGLFVAECDWNEFKPSERIPELTVATVLMSQIRSSQRFICLLTSRSRGSSVRIAETPLSSTFFELEIFQSIVLDKPTYLLVHESFDPAQIEQYLDLLEFAFPDWRGCTAKHLSDSQIMCAIDDIVRARPAAAQWQVRRRHGHVADFHLDLMNSRDRFFKRESKPTVHFINLGRQTPVRSQCNPDSIKSLLTERESLSADPDVNNDRRLAISWLLLRELCAAPLLSTDGEIVLSDPFLLSAWNLALSDWHSAASWGGCTRISISGRCPLWQPWRWCEMLCALLATSLA